MLATHFQFSPSQPAPPTVSERAWLIALLLVGIFLRLYRLDGHSLWSDEGIQYFISSASSISEVLERRHERTFHNALSFIIHHLFLNLQDSDFFLRLPSALFGIGTLPLAYLLTRNLLSRTAALCALFVFATSPFHVWYSQEARMYAPLLFTSLLSTLFLLKAVGHSSKAFWWVLYSGGVVLGIYLHIFMIITVMSHVIWLLVCHRRSLIAVVGCGLIAAILAFPVTLEWGQMFLRKTSLNKTTQAAVRASETGLKERVKIGWQGIPYAFFAYGAGFSLGPSVSDLHEHRKVGYLLRFLPSIVAVGLTWGLLLITGLWLLFTHGPRSAFWLCSLSLVSIITGVIALTTITRFTFNVRYVIIAYPYGVLVLSAALAFLLQKHAWLGTLALLALAALSALSLTHYFHNPRYAKENIRQAVQHWQAAETSSPLLSYSPAGGTGDAINRYLKREERTRHTRLSKKNIVGDVHRFFQTEKRQSAYILFARDWHQRREHAIRNAFSLFDEQVFPGVKIMQIKLN